MRILIVSQYFWPENFRINDLAVALRRDMGHEVTVLAGIPNYPDGSFFAGYGLWKKRREIYDGVEILRVPIVPRGQKSKLQLVLNYFSYALMATLLGPFLCRGQYDIIFVAQYSPVTVGLPGIMLKWAKRAPLFLWVQDLWPESLSATGEVKSKAVLNLVAGLVRFIYHRCDRILVQSRAFIPYIRAEAGPEAKIGYLPNWAESLYQPVIPDPGWVERQGLPAGFRVMFAGNIGAAQDFETILSAAELLRQYSEIHWLVLGDGRAREWVEQEIAKRDLFSTVHLLGRFPMEEMPAFFASAEAMLVTLKREPIFALTIPGKIQSYMACGRPIIAALDGEGQRVVAESGAGLTCPAESPTELADLVLQLYRMPAAERMQMGQRGRVYYEQNFSRQPLLERLNEWMKTEVNHG